MPRTSEPKRKPLRQADHGLAIVNGAGAAGGGGGAGSDEVLTLAEAAAYLRLPESEVVALVHAQDLPGRVAGSEWRFLKSAIQDWLRTGQRSKSNKEAWMQLAGVWKDDPYVDEELKEIYRRRGRPITGDKP